MNFFKYLKERVLFLLFYLINIIFIVSIVVLDADSRMRESNIKYLFTVMMFFFAIYLTIDYIIQKIRFKNIKNFIEQNQPVYDNYKPSSLIENEYIEALRKLQVSYDSLIEKIKNEKQDEIDFITSWIHNIKVPISVIKLQLESNYDEFEDEFIKSIEEEITKIEMDLDKVMYYIRINDFSKDYVVRDVTLEKMVSQSLKQYAKYFSYKKINLTLSNLDKTVLTDEKWSSFIISQIISNAVKYVDNYGNISIKGVNVEGGVSLIIEDDGIGIKKEDIKRVFNRGFTGYIGREGNKSTGYGLYLSKKLADKLGHELTVKSEFNKYTAFTLTFKKTDTIYDIINMTKM